MGIRLTGIGFGGKGATDWLPLLVTRLRADGVHDLTVRLDKGFFSRASILAFFPGFFCARSIRSASSPLPFLYLAGRRNLTDPNRLPILGLGGTVGGVKRLARLGEWGGPQHLRRQREGGSRRVESGQKHHPHILVRIERAELRYGRGVT